MPTTPFTVEEEQQMLLAYIRRISAYWAKQPSKTEQERCDGLAFSILAALDGAAPELPAYNLSISVHPSDKAYCMKNGERWHKQGLVITRDIELHDLYYKK